MGSEELAPEPWPLPPIPAPQTHPPAATFQSLFGKRSLVMVPAGPGPPAQGALEVLVP